MGLKGQTTGGGRGLMSNMIIIGLGFLFILIQTTTAAPTKLLKDESKTVKVLYDTPVLFCMEYGAARDAQHFLDESEAMTENAVPFAALATCCTGTTATEPPLDTCKYDDNAAAVTLTHQAPKPTGGDAGKVEHNATTTVNPADGSDGGGVAIGFSEKLILLTLLVAKLSL